MDEDRIVSGHLAVTMDGRAYSLPVLKIKHAKEWRELVGGAMNGLEESGGNVNAAPDRLLELVVAYDRSNVLGGQERVEESMTDTELYDAFLAMWRETFPFNRLAKDLMTLATSPAPARSPNGRSPSGVSTPTA